MGWDGQEGYFKNSLTTQVKKYCTWKVKKIRKYPSK